MILYRVLERHTAGRADNVLFRRHLCEWQLPQEVAMKVKYNPRHVPVIIRKQTNEDYYYILSVIRILRGWRTFRLTSASLPQPTLNP